MRFFDDFNLRRRLRASGQALILIVLTFMGLLLFLGLMVDLGQIFLAKGYLRRAADAAALAAAGQIREGRTFAEIKEAAWEVSTLNGISPTSLDVQTCKDGDPGPDPSLCPAPNELPRKLVRVTIGLDYPLTFLSLINIRTVHLVESSVSEAASMDVVLVIDISESMAWDRYNKDDLSINYTEDPGNPSYCNGQNPPWGDCHPFYEVKQAAMGFAQKILNKPPADEEDRLAIVTFANGWQQGSEGTQVVRLPPSFNGWTNDLSVALNPTYGIPSLKVYDPTDPCPANDSGCPSGPSCYASENEIPLHACTLVDYENPVGSGLRKYRKSYCPRTLDVDLSDGSTVSGDMNYFSLCNTTDIGGGLLMAGRQFEVEQRPDALWVVILLTDGAANATLGHNSDIGWTGDDVITPFDIAAHDPNLTTIKTNLPFGFCPDPSPSSTRPFCQDDLATTHHLYSDWAHYDADDFARDEGRFVACPAHDPDSYLDSCDGHTGQGAVLFTIGLGSEVLKLDADPVDPKPYGGELLRWLAALGDDGTAHNSDLCAADSAAGIYNTNCGNYFYAQTGLNLVKVFEQIYSRIYTRLTV
jgi:hypothetical protein